MARASKIKDKLAILPAQGQKISFGDDSDGDYPAVEAPAAPVSKAAKSRRMRDQTPSENSDDDDDDDQAPEAVGRAAGAKIEAEMNQKAESSTQARKQAAAARSRAIAAAKQSSKAAEAIAPELSRPRDSGQNKRKRAGESAEDADAARLRKRMEAAMVEADDETDDGDEEDDLSAGESWTDNELLDGLDDDEEEEEEEEEGGSDEDMESFHTATDDEEDEGLDPGSDEEDMSDADSETLREDGPLDDKTVRLRAQMQRMMEAAEQRAAAESGGKPGRGKSVSAAGPTTSGKPPIARKAAKSATALVSAGGADEDYEALYDLTPGMPQPLSRKTIEAGEAAYKAEREREAREAALRAERAKEKARASQKKVKRVEKAETTRKIDAKTTLQVLPPILGSFMSALPPVFAPKHSGKTAGKNAQKTFLKTAMKHSGKVPGAVPGSGRRLQA